MAVKTSRLNAFRLNAGRLNSYQPTYRIEVNGVDRTGGTTVNVGVRVLGATIQHALNHATDTAQFRVAGFMPVAGQTFAIWCGAKDLDHALFAGRIIETTALYEEKRELVAWDISCIDPTWLINRQKVLAKYTNQSATAIVLDIITRFTRGVTTNHVVPFLPLLDEITFTQEEVAQTLSRIADRIGAYWYVDYANDLHFFLNEERQADSITQAQPRGSRKHQLREDLSQVATGIIGRGGGASAAIDANPGQTELPVDEDAAVQSWYADAGGTVETGQQRLTYTGVKGRGGTGALVGTGNAPTAPPDLSLTSGASHGIGTYQYAVSYVTGSGETMPGGVATIQVTGATPPLPYAPQMRSSGETASTMHRLTPGGNYRWRIRIVYQGGGVVIGPASANYIGNDEYWEVHTGASAWTPQGWHYWPALTPSPPGPIVQFSLYRTRANGSTYYHDGNIPEAYGGDEWYTNYNQYQDSDLVSPLDSNSQFQSVYLSNVPVAGSGQVTARRVYRTTVNGAQLKLVATIANNTDVTFLDNVTDAALGANAPTTDTSGISEAKQVEAGATELPVSSIQEFTADGGAGWANVGNLMIRYTGTAAGKLTGIPATGLGALTAAVRYGTQVTIQPRLVGIPASGAGAIVYAIKKGDQVAIRYDEADAAAAHDLAVRFNIQPLNDADGQVWDVITDGRYALPELQNAVKAYLKDKKSPALTLTFESRDDSLEVGRTITINLTTPPIVGTFRIQRLTISEMATGAPILPLRSVEATNKLYTFQDLLRQIRSR